MCGRLMLTVIHRWPDGVVLTFAVGILLFKLVKQTSLYNRIPRNSSLLCVLGMDNNIVESTLINMPGHPIISYICIKLCYIYALYM